MSDVEWSQHLWADAHDQQLGGAVRDARPRHRLDGRILRLDGRSGCGTDRLDAATRVQCAADSAKGPSAAYAVTDRPLTSASNVSTLAVTVGHRYSRSTNASPDRPSASRASGLERNAVSASANS